jgi:two-component system response regulator FixJ
MDVRDVVAVVDDDEPNRDIVSQMLQRLGIEVRPYASANRFLDDPAARDAGCLVLDVRMPGMTGMELQRRLNEMQWRLPIVFLTAHGDVPMAVEAMRAGAMGFLLKPFKAEELFDSVQRALAHAHEQRVLRRRTQTVRARFDLLSSREREVLDLLASGLRSKDIAQALSISVKTVEEHRTNLMRKTRTASMLELVRLATEAAMLPSGGPRADGPR